MEKAISENVHEIDRRQQTLVKIENVFKFIAFCSLSGIVVSAGAYEVGADGVSIVGQWFYS